MTIRPLLLTGFSLAAALLLAGCQNFCPKAEPAAAGHQATITCLRSERAQTDGIELKCEDWSYVQKNYPTASGHKKPPG
ncbi:hypothetical protein KBY58_02290 [Cyanobium sp. HWJ4-Hawea]|uniref:hypothetical protein n=1 Tax=unclassified Cyanobium TaxID=2627006 RepID=UPI0020CF1E3A|nr:MULTISPECIES: hypothetical protein [unclassified Cyanobium]MCP9776065.1 hypothetical protein [Cyanobium sp. WAJ14-Wanaka]MCP9808262.1 hypothetical protein [Cyanobium sp. HWJ4-Hawea]